MRQQCQQWRIGIVALLVALAMFATPGVQRISAASSMQVSGNTYTSPSFGYSVTWDSIWFVAADESSGISEQLRLTNGVSYVVFSGSPIGLPPDGCLAANQIGLSVSMADVTPLIGSDGAAVQGIDDSRAFAAFTGTLTLDDGSAVDMAAYVDCQPIVPGVSNLTMIALMPRFAYDFQVPLLQTLLAGVAIPEPDQPSPAGQGDSDDGESDEPDEATASPEDDVARGEPAPVFVAGPWRVAVASSVRADAIEAARLAEKDGKEWIVLVADVTNWTGDDIEFTLDDLRLAFSGEERRYRAAPNSSRATARNLDIAQGDLEEGVPVEPGDTIRVALAYLVPDTAGEPSVVGASSGIGLPLTDVLGDEPDLAELPPHVVAPELQDVDDITVVDGEMVEVQRSGEDEAVRLRLLGVGAPARSDCYGDEAMENLESLVEGRVWIEEESTDARGSAVRVYLWAEDPNGQRVLVNQEQVASGFAEARGLDDRARFAVWIAETGRSAEAYRAGLWNECVEAGADDATPVEELRVNVALPPFGDKPARIPPPG